jgi:putative aldouronate transport system permease protein
MVEKLTKSRIAFNIVNVSLLALFCLICLVPLWHVFMSSISDPRMLMMSTGINWLPTGDIQWRAYEMVLNNRGIIVGYFNTFLYVTTFTLLGLALTAIGGYVLSCRSKLRGPMMLMVVITMMFSGGLIPSYMVNMSLGLIDNRLSVIIPMATNAFFIIIMKNAFEQLPESFSESAKLDGAGPLKIMLYILLPMVKATVAVIALFLIMLKWNSWFHEAIYLSRSRDLWPLQLVMREILVQQDVSTVTAGEAAAMANLMIQPIRNAVTIVGTLPVLFVYPFVQKYFVTGITLGGVKG